MITLGPGFSFGGSRTLSLRRGVWGTKGKRVGGWGWMGGGAVAGGSPAGGHEGNPVGGIGLYGVGACRSGQPVEGRGTDRAVCCERMDGHAPSLIVGGQQKPAGAVGGHIGGRVLRCDRLLQRQASAALI